VSSASLPIPVRRRYLVDGRPSDTEWTNQASIVHHVSNSKILFAWNGNTLNQIPRSSSNMSNW
jgi:hypothetical protein